MMANDVEVTQADRDAVTAFHNAQLTRILSGDKTLGENRDCIEQAFARHRINAQPKPTGDVGPLVERLRGGVCAESNGCLPQSCACEYMDQAADTIASQQAEIERYRDALQWIVDNAATRIPEVLAKRAGDAL